LAESIGVSVATPTKKNGKERKRTEKTGKDRRRREKTETANFICRIFAAEISNREFLLHSFSDVSQQSKTEHGSEPRDE